MIRTSRRPWISARLCTLCYLVAVACSSGGNRAAPGRATILDPSGAADSAAGWEGLGLPPHGTGGYAAAVTGGASSAAGSSSAAAVTAGSSGVAATTAGSSAATATSAPMGTGGIRVRGNDAACEGYPVEANPAADPETCVGVAFGAVPIPVDMCIMADRSSSMNELLQGSELTRWQVFAEAMQAFVNDPQAIASRVRLGLGFFGYSGTLEEQVECKPENYAAPVVPIGQLEQTGPLIASKIEGLSQSVGGSAPTHAAVQGALQYAAEHQEVEAGRVTVLLLVVGGLPSQCDEQSMRAVAELAGQAHQEHGVLTFVIGLAPGLENVNQIAAYGGSIEPAIVDSGADASQRLLEAILSISSTHLGCEFEIPTSTDPTVQVDYDRVRVLFHPVAGGTQEIPRLSTPSLCADSPYGGWFYDSSVSPSSIRVCDCNCNRLDAGLLEVVFGCEPLIFDLCG